MLCSVVYPRLFHLQTKGLFTWSLSLALWKLSTCTKSKTLLSMYRPTQHQKCTGWRITWLWLKISLRLLLVPTESRKQGKNNLLTLTLPCWLDLGAAPAVSFHCSLFFLPQWHLEIIYLFSTLKGIAMPNLPLLIPFKISTSPDRRDLGSWVLSLFSPCKISPRH